MASWAHTAAQGPTTLLNRHTFTLVLNHLSSPPRPSFSFPLCCTVRFHNSPVLQPSAIWLGPTQVPMVTTVDMAQLCLDLAFL